MFAGLLGLIFAGLFAGAAFYINFAEHPARMKLPMSQAFQQWAPSYKRGYTMQASLAILGALAGAVGWYLTGHLSFLVGGVVLLANWPFTLIVIMPVNKRLLSGGLTDEEIESLLDKWGRLHGVRTALGLLSTLVFFIGNL